MRNSSRVSKSELLPSGEGRVRVEVEHEEDCFGFLISSIAKERTVSAVLYSRMTEEKEGEGEGWRRTPRSKQKLTTRFL